VAAGAVAEAATTRAMAVVAITAAAVAAATTKRFALLPGISGSRADAGDLLL
jgi:hypothetical protein